MREHLTEASPDVVARVDALGGDGLIAVLDDLVTGEEEGICAWMDGQDDGFSADEVRDWEFADLVFRDGVVYIEVTVIVLGLYAGDEHMILRGSSAFVRLRPGPPLETGPLDLEPLDLRSFIAIDRGEDPPPRRPIVWVHETAAGLEVHGLPGPEAAPPGGARRSAPWRRRPH